MTSVAKQQQNVERSKPQTDGQRQGGISGSDDSNMSSAEEGGQASVVATNPALASITSEEDEEDEHNLRYSPERMMALSIRPFSKHHNSKLHHLVDTIIAEYEKLKSKYSNFKILIEI